MDPQTRDPLTYSLQTLPVSPRPPADIPESISIAVLTSLTDDTLWLNGNGGPSQAEIGVDAHFANASSKHMSLDGTTYRTSNPAVAALDVAPPNDGTFGFEICFSPIRMPSGDLSQLRRRGTDPTIST